MVNDFGQWLLDELNSRAWSQAELAKRSGLSPSTISLLISGQRGAGDDSALAIARALSLPIETVYRAAGLLPDLIDPRQAAVEILGYKLEELDDTQLDEVLQFIEFIQSRDDRRAGKGVKKTREGAAPPEAIKE